MFGLVVLWGARLSFNFWRKGGYQGLEDYRWEHVRKIIPSGFLWHLFNLTFISTYQTFLLLGICLPIYFEPQNSLDWTDGISASLCFLFLVGETVADQQQWNFQSLKYLKIKAGQTRVKNFLDSGLFKFSRHPNFFCEISLWWTFFSFTKGVWVAAVGAFLLNLLFHGSTEFTEKLSVMKYPEYREYQARTSRIVPWFYEKKKES
jgi:steroid 5-alpha reductase family enzyme